ncbi:MAG: hypothetical protein HPY80_03510 [Bacteroidales bacterium]|nr:hypothetical protein [Bacteroidales bacterium]
MLPLPAGLRSGVFVEIWTGELLKRFRSDPSWINEIPSRDDLVNNNSIHLVDIGADPGVLINNTTYPIPVVTRTDGDIAIALDKFETQNTAVTNDELYAISYDKMASVITQHKEVLEEKTADKAAHALAPASASSDTPIVLTTGASNGQPNARKRLIPQDIIRLKKALDDLKVPKIGRVLLLCNEHVEDLLMVDEVFANQYKNIPAGTVLNLYGFKIFEYPTMPVYKEVLGTLTKKAFGAASDPVNDQVASIAFYPQRAFKCKGELSMYYSEAKSDPEYRRNLVGFSLYDICLPKKWTGFGALVSAKV